MLGDRLGLGSAFRQGFAAVVDLLLLMTGFMALAPWLGTHLAPVITPVFSAVGCDPSLFASLFLSCDAGGAVLAAQIAQEPSAGLYNGLIVAAFLGSTINGTIPLALGRLTGTKRAAAVRGLFLGFLVLPVGCLLTGALCGIPPVGSAAQHLACSGSSGPVAVAFQIRQQRDRPDLQRHLSGRTRSDLVRLFASPFCRKRPVLCCWRG